MTTKEFAASIRSAYKAKGWTARDISVRIETYSMGSSIHVTIKAPFVNFAEAERIAKGAEVVRYCHVSGDILGGGNRYVHVSYSREAEDVIRAQYGPALTATAQALLADPSDRSLHSIAGTSFLLGRGQNGYGYSLWKDGHITESNDVLWLATLLHRGAQ